MPCKLGILGCNMRILRALVLGFLLVMATPAVPQQPEPKPVVEYNIASCGGSDFTVVHAVLNSDKTKFTFSDFLTSPTTSKKDPDPMVFDYKEEPKDKDGNISFTASGVLDKSQLVISGVIRGNRLVGVLTVDGDLGHLYYGYLGSLGDITIGAEDKFNFCTGLRSIGREKIPEALTQWLLDDETSAPDKSSKS